MHRKHIFLESLSVIAGLWLGLSTSLCYAASFTISVDTTSLVGNLAGPFALNFQLIDGGGTANNTAILSGFDFGGGGSTAADCTSATCTNGANVTSPPLIVTLTDDPFFGGSFLNQVILPFTPGSSGPLSFLLDLTTNVESGGGGSPDAFSLGILDSSGFGIPTSFFDVFVQIDITSPLIINTYASDPNTPPLGCPTCEPINIGTPVVQPAVSPVPEPGTLMLLATGLGGLAAVRRRAKR